MKIYNQISPYLLTKLKSDGNFTSNELEIIFGNYLYLFGQCNVTRIDRTSVLFYVTRLKNYYNETPGMVKARREYLKELEQNPTRKWDVLSIDSVLTDKEKLGLAEAYETKFTSVEALDNSTEINRLKIDRLMKLRDKEPTAIALQKDLIAKQKKLYE